MSETDKRDTVPVTDRRPWQPLHYDKISATDAEASFTLGGVDGGIYS